LLPEPLLRQLRRLMLKTRRAARERLAGHYEAAVRGAGLTFADVRPYQPGDDVRRLDWNVTARTGVPHVKRFIEERERIVYLCVDVSGSQQFGTMQNTKRAVAGEVAALLAFAAAARRDRVGLILFTDQIELRIIARKGDRHAHRIVRELFAYSPTLRGTNLQAALAPLRLARRGVVFLISDFRAQGWERALRVAARKHDIVAICVSDPAESELPKVGRLRMADAESGTTFIVNTSDSTVRHMYAESARARRETTLARMRAAGADTLEVSTVGGHLEALLKFFRSREHRP
jgi:uncharacterized protein (DUF58 family)